MSDATEATATTIQAFLAAYKAGTLDQGRLRLTASRTGFHELIFLASSK